MMGLFIGPKSTTIDQTRYILTTSCTYSDIETLRCFVTQVILCHILFIVHPHPLKSALKIDNPSLPTTSHNTVNLELVPARIRSVCILESMSFIINSIDFLGFRITCKLEHSM